VQLNPNVIVLNNGGDGTERRLLDGPFDELQPWQYRSIPEIVGGGKYFVINTEDEFDTALKAANQHLDGFCILDVRLDPNHGSAAMQRLDVLGKRVR
jgi:TPP-dependent 2-oxoacid decarboxylase